MKEKINVQLQPTLEQVHELMIVELRTQAVFQRNLGAGARYLNAAQAAFDKEDSNLVTGDGDVDLLVLLFGVARP
jgi:hypothetical protein